MQMISSPAGTRLAKAKVALDRDRARRDRGGDGRTSLDKLVEYAAAGDAVADELIAQGFHEKEGD